MQDGVDRTADVYGFGDVVPHEFEPGMAHQMSNILLRAGEKVVQANDVIAHFKQTIAQMTANKPDSARDNSLHDLLLQLVFNCRSNLRQESIGQGRKDANTFVQNDFLNSMKRKKDSRRLNSTFFTIRDAVHPIVKRVQID